MNYAHVYNSIIEKAKEQNRKRSKEIKYENHHITPKCLNGNNDKENLVLLTLKEHFIVHKLLTYMYPGTRGLILAFYRMTFDKNKKFIPSARDYVYAKELVKLYPQKSHYDTWVEKYGVDAANFKETERKLKIKNAMIGVKYSEERKNNAAVGHIGLKQKEETIKSRIEKNTGLKRKRMICPYCNRDIAVFIFNRLHNDGKCKFFKYSY